VFVRRAGQADLVVAPASPDSLLDDVRSSERGLGRPHTGGDRHVLATTADGPPVSFDAYRQAGGYTAFHRAIDLGPAGIIDEIVAANLRGRGGAAFPTGVKWRGVADAPGAVRYLVCNADESEPGTFKDRVLMEGNPFGLVEAMTIAGFAVGAEKGFLYIRGEYPEATAAMAKAVDEARAAEMLGQDVAGAGFSFDIEIRRGQGAYICGEETALFNSIEGYRGEPRQKPPFPTTHGLFGKPTVVNNVETLFNVVQIMRDGTASYLEHGTSDSTGTRLFCLSGDVVRPGVYEMPFGTTLRQVLDLAGTDDGVQAVLLGGAAGSFVGPAQFDLPLTFEDSRAAGLSLGSGVIMAFGPDRDMTEIARRIAEFFRDESCGQCVPCRVGTVRIEEALARARGGGLEADLIVDIDVAMKDASICGLGHTAGTAIRSAIDLGLVPT